MVDRFYPFTCVPPRTAVYTPSVHATRRQLSVQQRWRARNFCPPAWARKWRPLPPFVGVKEPPKLCIIITIMTTTVTLRNIPKWYVHMHWYNEMAARKMPFPSTRASPSNIRTISRLKNIFENVQNMVALFNENIMQRVSVNGWVVGGLHQPIIFLKRF